jgi:hypothetical protein
VAPRLTDASSPSLNLSFQAAALKTLLMYGTLPNAKDSQDRTPLEQLLEQHELRGCPAELTASFATLLAHGARYDDSTVEERLKRPEVRAVIHVYCTVLVCC